MKAFCGIDIRLIYHYIEPFISKDNTIGFEAVQEKLHAEKNCKIQLTKETISFNPFTIQEPKPFYNAIRRISGDIFYYIRGQKDGRLISKIGKITGNSSRFGFLTISLLVGAVVCIFLIVIFTCKSEKEGLSADEGGENEQEKSQLEMTKRAARTNSRKNDKLESI